jgi:transcriptional regulator with XRE-family HTH domain
MSTFAERLKQVRTKKKLTQKKVAEKTGLIRATLANWEIGRAEPDLESIKTLANFYNVPVDYLLGRTDDVETLEKDIESAISGHPELMEIWSAIKNREDLQSLFREVKPMTPENVKKVIRIIKALEDEKKEG